MRARWRNVMRLPGLASSASAGAHLFSANAQARHGNMTKRQCASSSIDRLLFRGL